MKQLKKADLKTLLGLGTDMLTLTLAHTWPRVYAVSCSCRGRDHLLQAGDRDQSEMSVVFYNCSINASIFTIFGPLKKFSQSEI